MKQKRLLKIKDANNWGWYQRKDGLQLLGVTTGLEYGLPKKQLENYYKNTSKAKIEQNYKAGCDFGSKAHDYFERILLGDVTFAVDASHIPHIKVFRAWIAKHNLKPIGIELHVESEKFGYAGTCDCLGHLTACEDRTCCKVDFGTKLMVIDWKTSKSFGVGYGYQLAAYRQALIETGDIDEGTGMIGFQIRNDTAAAQSYIYEHYDYCFHKFLCALEQFKGINFYKLKEMQWPYLDKQALIINLG